MSGVNNGNISESHRDARIRYEARLARLVGSTGWEAIIAEDAHPFRTTFLDLKIGLFDTVTSKDINYVLLTPETQSLPKLANIVFALYQLEECPRERVVEYCKSFLTWINATLDVLDTTFETLYVEGGFDNVKNFMTAVTTIMLIADTPFTRMDMFSEYVKRVKASYIAQYKSEIAVTRENIIRVKNDDEIKIALNMRIEYLSIMLEKLR
tara:strand:+ start:34706 stop:35335 length:630 start_codon:yes stop_codon:yes gene_type:complete